MRAQLLATERPLQPPGAADAETIKKLASLGYLASRAPDAAAKDLPDPKDRIQTLGRMREASRLDRGPSRERRRFAAAGPDGREPAHARGVGAPHARAAAVRPSARGAGGPGTRGSAAARDAADPRGSFGSRPRERRSPRRRALCLAAPPRARRTSRRCSRRIDLAAGDCRAREKEALEAIAERGRDQGPLVLLAEVEAAAGNLEAALAALRRADALGKGRPPVMSLEATRGDVLSRMGEEKAAEEAFAAEIGSFPGESRCVVASGAALRERRTAARIPGPPVEDDGPSARTEVPRGSGPRLRNRGRQEGGSCLARSGGLVLRTSRIEDLGPPTFRASASGTSGSCAADRSWDRS